MIEKLKCRDCKDRHVGCHGTCEHYLNWKKENDKIQIEIHKKRWYEELGKPQKKIRTRKK